jgi:UDP-N-acetylmuramyl pentapeptide phosphotransferase/UDP-N-acetylglucosamine-1-phosphate transferase
VIPVTELIWLVLAALASSFAASLLIVKSQSWHGQLSCDHDLSGVQKVHTMAVPRVGGLAVFTGIALGLLLVLQVNPDLPGMQAFLLLASSLPAFVAGIVEDLTKAVTVRVRLAATVLSALLASAVLGATVHELDIWAVDTLLALTPVAIAVTALAVAGGSNAVNIIDGFNGLSGSTVVIMALAFGAVALQYDDALLAMLCALGVGATIGFLLLNYPSGKLFLGDGGAYFLGFWVAEIAVLLLVRHAAINAWQMLSICAFPIIEVLFSIYRRRVVRKASPGAPDALHLHTLVYRRLVFKYVALDRARPWKRNAAVVCAMAPVVGGFAAASVAFGKTGPAAAGLVLAQLMGYVMVYGRLVRGRWSGARAGVGVLAGADGAQLR